MVRSTDDASRWARTGPGDVVNLLHALLAEHSVMNDSFDHLERVVCSYGSLDMVRGSAVMVRRALDLHTLAEEGILLPAFPTQGLGHGPLPVVRHEHQKLEAGFDGLLSAQTLPEAVALCVTLLEDLRTHFSREEETLFPLAWRILGEQRLLELGSIYATNRNIHLAPLLAAAHPV